MESKDTYLYLIVLLPLFTVQLFRFSPLNIVGFVGTHLRSTLMAENGQGKGHSELDLSRSDTELDCSLLFQADFSLISSY